MDTTVISPLVVPAAPFIAIVLQLVKGWIPALATQTKVLPWVSLGLGAIAAIASGTGGTLFSEVLNGVLAGLLASGGYDAITSTSITTK